MQAKAITPTSCHGFQCSYSTPIARIEFLRTTTGFREGQPSSFV
jgi:hypothetical protein